MPIESLLPPLPRSTPLASGAATGSSSPQAKQQAARQVAEELEAVFLGQMLAPMLETVEQDSLFGGGPGQSAYRSMMAEEIGKAVARSGGVGLADAVLGEILKLQEGAP